MRATVSVLAVLLVILAGCTSPLGGDAGTTEPPASTTASNDTMPSEMVDSLSDPAEDTIGWEAGLWHNETIDVTNTDGMNATERELAVARAMARVEVVRQLEFPGNDTIPVDVISREEYKERTSSRNNFTDAYRTFDNVKFEAMLFIGENDDSLAVQKSNHGSTIQGYYSLSNDTIVLISEGETPSFDGEETLAQEVAHALQDFTYNLTALQDGVETRDAYNGQDGLVEGDANLIDELYVQRCDTEWSCIPAPSDNERSGGSDDLHRGVYLMKYFPYSDGPVFIDDYYDRGGWDRIDQMYEDPPSSAEQVIYPDKYQEDLPENISIEDQTDADWERLKNAGEHNRSYATLGQSALSAMFMYPSYSDYKSSFVVSPRQFLNTYLNGSVKSSDPLDYDLPASRGWEGDRMHIYHQPGIDTNETGYVWRITWESTEDAEQFADQYGDLLKYWDGSEQGANTWVVEESSPFSDAFKVMVEGDTVTIVNAPTVEDLGDVYRPAG